MYCAAQGMWSAIAVVLGDVGDVGDSVADVGDVGDGVMSVGAAVAAVAGAGAGVVGLVMGRRTDSMSPTAKNSITC